MEPEWDDRQRTLMLAIGRYEYGICECGQHVSVANDTDNYFTFENRVCNVCMHWARFRRIQAERDEQMVKALGPDPKPHEPLPTDGRHTDLKPLTAEEVARRRRPQAGQSR